MINGWLRASLRASASGWGIGVVLSLGAACSSEGADGAGSGGARGPSTGGAGGTSWIGEGGSSALAGSDGGGTGGTGGSETAQPTKLQVFILSGQSNMQGLGFIPMTQSEIDKNGGLGTLTYLVTEEPDTYGHLGTPDAWTERDDVWIVDLDKEGPLTVNYGAFSGRFGPELQFGHVVGDHYDAPVLLIKAAWGGKSLAVDFRPPSSGGTVGPYYTMLIDRVHEVLDNLATHMPSYDGKGYDIAGFAWHQGWNDRINQTYTDEYQTNCVNLINDLRVEFDEPEMPFALAITGMGGWDETGSRPLKLMEAQLAVPTDPRLAAGFVAAVETRAFWRTVELSPRGQGYHWNQNAETYFLIGGGLGEAILELKGN